MGASADTKVQRRSHFSACCNDRNTPRIRSRRLHVQKGSRFWIGAAMGLTIVQLVASAVLPRGLALTAVSDIVPALQMLALVLIFASNAIFGHGRLRSVWVLQAAGMSFWLADQCAFVFYDVVLRKPLPDMFLGDVLLFLSGVPMLAGLLLRPHFEPSQRSVRLGMLDFLQLMLWWLYIYVYLVMCWQYVSVNTELYNRNFDWLYLVEILVVAAVLGMLLTQSTGEWRSFYALFLAAVMINCLSVAATDAAIEAKTYFNGSWYDTPFSASLAIFMAMAVKGRGLTPAQETDNDRRYGSWMASLAGVAVLSMPVIVVLAILAKGTSAKVVHFRVVITAATMFMMATLLFVKQRRLHQELKRTNSILEKASMTDPLTGIRNRRFFSATIEGDVAQTLRAYGEGNDRSMRDLVFYLIDLDNFKEVNDLYGHDAGDRVLIEAARRIGCAIRESDVLLRWGGEEFLVVSRSADRTQADALALRVIQAVRGEPFSLSATHEIRQTCSIGWAAFPWRETDVHGMGYEEVLNQADRALGQAKRAGKDQAIGMAPVDDGVGAAPGNRRGAEMYPMKDLQRSERLDLQLSNRT
jgi:diguanylate cyclase (GGDEF)-like protein